MQRFAPLTLLLGLLVTLATPAFAGNSMILSMYRMGLLQDGFKATDIITDAAVLRGPQAELMIERQYGFVHAKRLSDGTRVYSLGNPQGWRGQEAFFSPSGAVKLISYIARSRQIIVLDKNGEVLENKIEKMRFEP